MSESGIQDDLRTTEAHSEYLKYNSEYNNTRHIRKHTQLWPPQHATLIRIALASCLTIVLFLSILLHASIQHVRSRQRAARMPIVTNGATEWLGAHQTTAPKLTFSPPTNPAPQIDAAFQTYYAAHAGPSLLGMPVTTAVPMEQGLVQFFTDGALLLPAKGHMAATSARGGIPEQLIRDGQTDTATGIVRLPLLHTLLTAGSKESVDVEDDNNTLTYADLRRDALPNAMVKAPATSHAASSTQQQQNTFIAEGHEANVVIGHRIPISIWNYITDPTVAPDGWQSDFGLPLTEAIAFTAMHNGTPQHMLVQAFWQGVVLVNKDQQDSSGHATITHVNTGIAYLQTLGLPTPSLPGDQHVWTLGNVALLNAPATGAAVAHVGQNFSLFATGKAQWAQNELWYEVSWITPGSSGSGWISATQATLAAPDSSAPAWASFDTLSPDLAIYLASQGTNIGAAVYDVTRNQYYTYNERGQFIMASSAKVPIMLAFLMMTESQGREPNDDEMSLLTTMIENSNNDSAQALFDEIGGAPALASSARQAGVSGFNPDPDAWGWSTISPLTMVQLLAELQQGKLLTAQDRALAFNLMGNIESDQQIGVGDTAPAGAKVVMKDGWVLAPDGYWAMNTSGIVTVGHETYIISVYTQHQNSLDSGWSITQHICGSIGHILATA